MKDDKIYKDLLKTTEENISIPEGFKAQLLADIMNEPEMLPDSISSLERLLYQNPLKFIFPLSILISSAARIIAGSGFNRVILSIFGLGGM